MGQRPMSSILVTIRITIRIQEELAFGGGLCRVRPKFGFGFGYGAETDLTYGFGYGQSTLAQFQFRPKHYSETPKL